MKIYPKLLLIALPLIVFPALLVGLVSYRTSRDAIQSVVQDVLGTRLARVVKICEENQAVLRRYGLENVPANVAKARENAAIAMQEIRFGETGYVFAVNAQGSVRGHPDADVVGRDVSAEPWFQEIVRAGKGNIHYVWQGEDRCAAFEYFDPWEWYIISSGAESELAGAINRLSLYTMLLLAVSLIVATAALLFLTRWLTAPIHALIAGIERIGQGELDTHIPVTTSDEVGVLATAFNSMTAQLRDLIRSLEQRIAERERAEESLQESEQRYRVIMEASLQGTYQVDAKGRIIFASPATTELTGYSLAELDGLSVDALYPPGEAKAINDANVALLYSGKPIVGENTLTRKDGSRVETYFSCAPVFDERGEYTGFVGSILDITERKRAEESLRESEERYRTLFEETTDAILIVRPDGKIIDANPSSSELLGATGEKIMGTDVRQFYGNPADHEAILQEIDRNGFARELDWQVRRKDGNMRSCVLTSSAWRDEHGNILAYLSSVRDITERKKSEEERERLLTAIEQSPETILITDTDGTIQYVNPGFETVTGYTRKEVLGKNSRILKSGQHDEAFYREMWETINNGRVWSGHFVNRKKDGTLFQEEATISPVKDESGRIINYVAVKRDVTSEVLLEKQLRQAQKMEAIGTLAGGIAHDFNNLLQVIQGYVDIGLLKLGKGQPGPSEFQEIRRAARSAADLTEGLLTFSRQFESKLRPVDLNHELEQVAKMLNRTISKMIAIELNLADDLDTINGDPAQLQQVVMNLAVNARDAMPGGGELHIQTQNAQLDAEYCKLHLGTKPGRYVLVSVTDSGFGMEKEIVEHIFEPFFTTKGLGEGTGLGLSIAYGIVQSHGGSITCYSEPGEGTTFKVYLPTMGNQVDTEESRDADFLPRGHETILLVEDEEAIRNSGESILSLFGYSVLTAANGREGLELYREKRHEIALVILDLIMPEMSGRDCLREILSIDPNAKVLIASGYTANGRIDQALREKARAFLRKPYEAQRMLTLVRQILDTESPGAT